METNNSKLPRRSEISDEFKWNLEDIYENEEKWNLDFEKVKILNHKILEFKGKFSENSYILLDCLNTYDDLFSLLDKVFVYARMKRDEDNTNSKSQEIAQKAESLITESFSAASYIVPEIISLEEETLQRYFEENSDLQLYKQHIDEIIRQKKHILSDKEEKIIAMSFEISSNSKNIFSMFNNADIKFPFVKNENGEMIELTKGRYITFLESTNRNVRKNSFEAMYKTYANHKNTLSEMLIGNIKANKFYSATRKYSSILESSLDADNIKVDVYNNLINTVNDNLHLLKRDLLLRKKILKVKKLKMYDLYVPLFEDSIKNIEYEKAVDLVKESLKPLGEEYRKNLDKAFSNRWIDIYENEGKTSGAYSWGSYLTHPYVLLNYQGKLNDVFTLTHELGHALHSYYTNITQPYIYSEYKIFVAEVASTVNEALLTRHMLNNSKNKNETASVLNHFLVGFRATLFRQVMFAEFEKIIHERFEKGEPLNSEILCDIYYNLNLKYYGEVVDVDKDIAMEWSRIPHFYNSFYVYKYATGLSSALSISKQLLDTDNVAVDKYLNFLKSGSSDYPIELLKKTGVDLTTPSPIIDALSIFKDSLDKLEECIN